MKFKLNQKAHITFAVKVKEADPENATIEAVFSTADEDRHGQIVEQNFDLGPFKKNPVILNSHNYDDVGEIVGRADKIGIVDGKLEGMVRFAVNENPKAKIVYDLYASGFANAFSIGGIPKEFDDKGNILKMEIVEISVVSVPANARALAKKKGIDIDQLYEKSEVRPNAKDPSGDGSGDPGDGDGGQGGGQGDQDPPEHDAGNKRAKPASQKEFENWDEGDSEIRLKIRDIAEFVEGTFKKIGFKTDMPRINAIVATPKGGESRVIQSVMFPKEDGWTMDDAKKWYSMNQERVHSWQASKSIDKDLAMKPFANEHACRLNDPEKYERFRRVNGDREVNGKKIDVIYGIKSDGKSEEQAYRYPKGDWSVSDARKHCKSHNGSFEAARESMSDESAVACAISEMVDEQTERYERRQKLLANVSSAIAELRKGEKVETRHEGDGANERRVLSKAIRELLKEKKQIN